MRVLVACEESQAVTIELRKLGHEAYSCDLEPCSGGYPEWHLQQDVLTLLDEKWDMIIAFPPCTYLCNTGTPHLNIQKYGQKAIERYKLRDQAFDFFMKFAKADCEKIIIENPVGYANTQYRKPNQIIQPWQFGDNFAKTTCLWLKGVEPLIPTVSEKPLNCKSYAHATMYDDNGKTISWSSDLSKKLRSKTFPGIAKAMAEQWAGVFEEEIE